MHILKVRKYFGLIDYLSYREKKICDRDGFETAMRKTGRAHLSLFGVYLDYFSLRIGRSVVLVA
jgi:hypothetical protein